MVASRQWKDTQDTNKILTILTNTKNEKLDILYFLEDTLNFTRRVK